MKLKKPEVFTINRSKWVQGGEKVGKILGMSELLNGCGNMCCLGFYAKQCGVPEDKLSGIATPEQIRSTRVPYMTTKVKAKYKTPDHIVNSELAKGLMSINDHEEGSINENLSLKEKEKAVREKFKEIDVRVRFTGKYPEGVEDAFA